MKKRDHKFSLTLFKLKDVLKKLKELKDVSENCETFYKEIIERLEKTFDALMENLQSKIGSYRCKFEDLKSI